MVCIFQHPALLTHDQLSVDHYLTDEEAKKETLFGQKQIFCTTFYIFPFQADPLVGLLFAVKKDLEITCIHICISKNCREGKYLPCFERFVENIKQAVYLFLE